MTTSLYDPATQEIAVPDFTVSQRLRAERRKLAAEQLKAVESSPDGEMVGNIYVPRDKRGDYLKSAANAFMGYHMDKEEADETKQLAEVRSELLRRMPSEHNTIPAAGPVQEGEAPLTRQVLNDQYDEQAKRWALQAGQVPGMAPAATAMFGEAVKGPQRREAREARATELTEGREARANETAATRAAAKERADADRAARGDIAEQNRALRRDITAAVNARAADGKSDKADANTDKIGARLYDDFNRNTKDQQTIINAHEGLKATNQRKDAASDISFVFQFMKMLDPTSVVREGEFATAQNAAGVPERVSNLYNKVMKGERLSPKQRDEFLATANNLSGNARSRIKQVRGDLSRQASKMRVDPDTYLPSFEEVAPTEQAPKTRLRFNPATGRLE